MGAVFKQILAFLKLLMLRKMKVLMSLIVVMLSIGISTQKTYLVETADPSQSHDIAGRRSVLNSETYPKGASEIRRKTVIEVSYEKSESGERQFSVECSQSGEDDGVLEFRSHNEQSGEGDHVCLALNCIFDLLQKNSCEMQL